MLAVIQKGGVLKFVAILNVGYAEPAAAVPSKRSANIHGRPGLQRRVLVVGMNKLEPRLVDCMRSDDLGVRCLKRVLHSECVGPRFRQIELPHIRVRHDVAKILVTHGQGVIRRKLIINPRTQVRPGLRIRNRKALGNDGEVVGGIKHRRADDVQRTDIAPLDVEKERSHCAARC